MLRFHENPRPLQETGEDLEQRRRLLLLQSFGHSLRAVSGSTPNVLFPCRLSGTTFSTLGECSLSRPETPFQSHGHTSKVPLGQEQRAPLQGKRPLNSWRGAPVLLSFQRQRDCTAEGTLAREVPLEEKGTAFSSRIPVSGNWGLLMKARILWTDSLTSLSLSFPICKQQQETVFKAIFSPEGF